MPREMARVDGLFHVLLSPDLLALVFRTYFATEAIIETLLRWKVVSKNWHVAISCVVVDIKWLAPFCCSADEFVAQIAGLVFDEHADESADTSLARKQADADHYVDMMFLHMYSEHAQYEALSLLHVVVGQTFMQEQACTRAIAAVNMAMTVHASFQRVQQAACVVIQVLAKNELNKDALLEAGTLDKMLQAGHRFSAAGNMTGLIICAVNQMIFCDVVDGGHQTSIEAVISAGAIPMVIGWMGADTGTSQLSCFADFCLFINSLARLHATALLDANTHEVIFGCLANFPDNPWLQWRGFHSLKLLVCFGEADAIDFFDDSRGMQLVYACVDYPHKVGFVCTTQENAINLLEAIVCSYPNTTDHMVAAGLIPVLQKTMAQTMNRTRLHRIVHMNVLVSVLSTLASNVTYRSTVAAAHIVPMVCLAMQAFEHDIMFQTCATILLGHLYNSASNALESAVPREVVRLVTQAMQNHEDSIMMQRAGVWGITCFVVSTRNIQTVSTKNVVNVLLRSIWKFNINPYIAKTALRALNILSAHGDNIAYMQNTGIVHSVLIAMQHHTEDIEVQTEAISTLFHWVEANPQMHADFCRQQGMWEMHRVLKMPGLDAKSRKMGRQIMEACAEYSPKKEL